MLEATPENKPMIGLVDFWKDYIPCTDGSGKLDEVVWVRWARKGTTSTTEDKVSRLMKTNPVVWSELERHYKAWKEGNEVKIDGTPLEVCNFITKEQLKFIKSIRIYSCEEFANCSDSLLAKINFPGVRGLKEKVKLFVNSSANNATTNQIAELTARMERLAQENAEQRELIEKLAEKEEETEEEVVAKPKRGRPKKTEIKNEGE